MGTPAQNLTGLTLDGGWIVSGPAPAELAPSGGVFAATYIVESADGRKGFLKALDYARAFESPDPSLLLEPITAAFNFERQLLRKCRDRGLDRVVTALTDGSVRPSGTLSEVVQYLIFELHDGDARSQADTSRRFDIGGSLRALHHIATGLAQLHKEGIAHQNLRPVTVWNYGNISKVADLSQAESRERHLVDGDSRMPSDPSYEPPEFLYGYRDPEWIRRGYSCDLYLLGSMAAFFFSGVPTTGLLRAELHDSHAWDNWSGTYEEVLPYLHEAFERVLQQLGRHVDDAVASQLTALVAQLCNPDPRFRGHPFTRATKGNPYSLERYVSAFDLLARRAEISFWGSSRQ